MEKQGNDAQKKQALDEFKNTVGRHTPAYFETPDRLALDVILALDEWEARGRPGARKTFATTQDYFAGKNPAGVFQLLDFNTTLLGREDHIRSLDEFLEDSSRRIAVLSGKGGIGKSKILYDWAEAHSTECIFLKDEPLWHEDSEREIPHTCRVIIIDDAHRLGSFGKALQLLQDTAKHQPLKLIVSTRPGSATVLSQKIYRQLNNSQISDLPEL